MLATSSWRERFSVTERTSGWRRVDGGDVRSAGAGRIAALAERLGLRNEFDPGDPPARESIAFLRRHGADAGDIADADVLGADWVIHVASRRREAVAELVGEVRGCWRRRPACASCAASSGPRTTPARP